MIPDTGQIVNITTEGSLLWVSRRSVDAFGSAFQASPDSRPIAGSPFGAPSQPAWRRGARDEAGSAFVADSGGSPAAEGGGSDGGGATAAAAESAAPHDERDAGAAAWRARHAGAALALPEPAAGCGSEVGRWVTAYRRRVGRWLTDVREARNLIA